MTGIVMVPVHSCHFGDLEILRTSFLLHRMCLHWMQDEKQTPQLVCVAGKLVLPQLIHEPSK